MKKENLLNIGVEHKVWECKQCGLLPCVAEGRNKPEGCLYPETSREYDTTRYWEKTTRYEITERKPDYAAMAEAEQLGTNGGGNYARLIRYEPESECGAFVMHAPHITEFRWKNFTPCAEPVEIDPHEWRAEE